MKLFLNNSIINQSMSKAIGVFQEIFRYLVFFKSLLFTLFIHFNGFRNEKIILITEYKFK